jgi:hypothetical protein
MSNWELRVSDLLRSSHHEPHSLFPVIPAKAGIQGLEGRFRASADWIPAFAVMTVVG